VLAKSIVKLALTEFRKWSVRLNIDY